MATMAGLDYVALEFNKDGTRFNLGDPIYPPGVTDLLIISHGWHQDAPSSLHMYSELVEHLVAEAGADWDGRKFGVCGVFWPSDKFRDDLGEESVNVVGGHAAAVGGGSDTAALKKLATQVADFLGIQNPDFARLAARAANGGGDANTFIDALRMAAGQPSPQDNDLRLEHEQLLTRPGSEIVTALAAHAPVGVAAPAAGTVAAAGFNVFSGLKAGVAKALNQVAYYELKKRAGEIGRALGHLLDSAPGIGGIRIHLVGHSFGGRLVTSAASVMKHHPKSMTLLQAAFSHNAFGRKCHYPPFAEFDGAFRQVVVGHMVDGPIAVTHTWNDRAVGLAYPAASRVSQTIAAGFVKVTDGFGGAADIYGGLGSNGALWLPDEERTPIIYDGQADLALRPHHITNLQCDFISSHTDVSRVEVARVLRAAVR